MDFTEVDFDRVLSFQHTRKAAEANYIENPLDADVRAILSLTSHVFIPRIYHLSIFFFQLIGFYLNSILCNKYLLQIQFLGLSVVDKLTYVHSESDQVGRCFD